MANPRLLYGLIISIVLIGGLQLARAGFSQGYEKRRLFNSNCDNSYSVTCLKLDVVSFIDKFSNKTQFELMPGVSVVRDFNSSDARNAEIVAEMAKTFPNDAEKRLDGYLFTKLSNFLQAHTIKLKLVDPTTVEEARSTFDGRKSKLKKSGLEAILAAGMMMKGTLMAIALGGLFLLAGKALMTGLMALMLSAILGLRTLTGRGALTSYEIVTRPFVQATHSHAISHEDINGHSAFAHTAHGSYSRSMDLEQLAKNKKKM